MMCVNGHEVAEGAASCPICGAALTGAAAQTTPAGWYPDPSGTPGQRYWDGQAWGQLAPAFGAAAPGAVYGIDPISGLPFSEKSKLAAGLLNIFIAGVGRMYMGQVGLGVAQLLVAIFTCGLGALWSLIDGIVILAGQPRDSQGRPLRS